MSNYVFVHPAYASCTQKTKTSFERCLRKNATRTLPELEAPGAVKVSRSKELIQLGDGIGISPCPTKSSSGCKLRLQFPKPAEALKAGLPPGTVAALTKCVRKGKRNPIVPVSSVQEALELSRRFCDCVGDEKGVGVREKCARKGAS